MKRVLVLQCCMTLPTVNRTMAQSIRDQLKAAGIDARVDAPIWCINIYQPIGEELDSLPMLTGVEDYDVIIVGNNLGSGLAVVSAIPAALRSRVVVANNTSRLDELRAYDALGIHMMTNYGNEIKAALDLLTPTAS